ncbi:MAG: dephospho-CoA kinase [Lachnospiraceae bacterium]|nr:dephospho-CoA kinase [Lachnospiraceae bacterium]
MKTIGITGGVGAGKSEILIFLEKNYKAKIVRADEIAHLVMQPGKACYMRIVSLLGDRILNVDGTINRKEMGEMIFGREGLISSVNSIVHPAVKEYILNDEAYERQNGRFDYYFLESALLVMDGYERLCEELWYVHTDLEVRKERLKASRGYTDEHIENIMRNQPDDSMFRTHSMCVIDNSGALEDTYKQIRSLLGAA